MIESASYSVVHLGTQRVYVLDVVKLSKVTNLIKNWKSGSWIVALINSEKKMNQLIDYITDLPIGKVRGGLIILANQVMYDEFRRA